MVEMDPPKLIVVTDFLLCGWPIMGTNFREWVQTFQQKFVLGGTKFRGVQIKRNSYIVCVHS